MKRGANHSIVTTLDDLIRTDGKGAISVLVKAVPPGNPKFKTVVLGPESFEVRMPCYAGKDSQHASWTGKALGAQIKDLPVGDHNTYSVAFDLGAMKPEVARVLKTHLLSALIEDRRFKSKPGEPKVFHFSKEDISAAQLREAESSYVAAQLVTDPPNVLTPSVLERVLETFCAQSQGTLSLKVHSYEECVEMGMGCFTAVAAASSEPAKFFHLTYTPKESHGGEVAFVGKGLLFDTGGINIKQSCPSLFTMKLDKGGCAAVVGLAHYLATNNDIHHKVHILSAVCENNIGSQAYHPSDILTAMNGMTVEVYNTDAEGRLTMADVLSYIGIKIPSATHIVELSTLTGATAACLGDTSAALFSIDDYLNSSLIQASKDSGDTLTQINMPFFVNGGLVGDSGDLRNCGRTMPGGSIQAAAFLKRFVKSEQAFAHIDMPDVAMDSKCTGTGYGTKLLINFLRTFTKP